jgi:replicative DNA helicase Mcm
MTDELIDESPEFTVEELTKMYSVGGKDARAAWGRFFKSGIKRSTSRFYKEDVDELLRLYPEKKSLVVDWFDLSTFDEALADSILIKPDRVLSVCERLLHEMVQFAYPYEERVDVRLRLVGLLASDTVAIRHLRQDHVGKLICIEGLVRQASEVRPRMTKAKYRCSGPFGCGHVQTIDLTEEDERIEPIRCSNKPDGCGEGKGTIKLVLLPETSEYIDTQDIYVQEMPEGMGGNGQPESILCQLEHDLCADDVRVNPGDRVRVSGIVIPKPIKKKNALHHELIFKVIGIEQSDNEFDAIVVTDEDIAEFKKAVLDPAFIDHLADCIGTSIKGYTIEKKAIALQLIGGAIAQLDDGTKTRGDIHILLAGDPGVAKTQLLRAVQRMSPRAVYAQGGSTSKVGLTVATVRDEITGRWALQAGSLVLADGGIALVDEIDKMSEEEAAGMHEAMESQTITHAKAGIRAEMKCREPILAAANPIHGRWDPDASFSEQLGLRPALLSRFDLIFAPRDRADKKKDEAIAEHIIKRRTGKIPKAKYDTEFARKFFYYAKRQNVQVDYEPAAAAKIAKFYSKLRDDNKEGESNRVTVTPRQNEGIARLAEAAARARLRNIVTVADVDVALEIVEEYLQQLKNPDTGKIDEYKQYSDTTSSERSVIETISHAMKSAGSTGLYIDDIQKMLPHVQLERIEKILDKMSKNGEFYNVGGKMVAVSK